MQYKRIVILDTAISNRYQEIKNSSTEAEMAGRLVLLHKGGSKSDQISHWRSVVLLNITNQLIAYVINERLTEMVEHMGILT